MGRVRSFPSAWSLVPGHFQRLRDDPRLQGPRGTRFVYAGVPSYLDTTRFNRLVETGLIGTTGTSTELLHDQIMQQARGRDGLLMCCHASTAASTTCREQALRFADLDFPIAEIPGGR